MCVFARVCVQGRKKTKEPTETLIQGLQYVADVASRNKICLK